MAKVRMEIDENDLRKLVLEHLRNKLGNAYLTLDQVKIETKSKQNYRSEWESGAGFRAVYESESL